MEQLVSNFAWAIYAYKYSLKLYWTFHLILFLKRRCSTAIYMTPFGWSGE